MWSLQTTKDVLGRVNHATLPISMRNEDTPLQRLRNKLDDKVAELEKAQVVHAQEKKIL